MSYIFWTLIFLIAGVAVLWAKPLMKILSGKLEALNTIRGEIETKTKRFHEINTICEEMANDGWSAESDQKRRTLTREQEGIQDDVSRLKRKLEGAGAIETGAKFFGWINLSAGIALLFFAGLTFFHMNSITVPKNNIYYLDRVLGGADLPAGASFARGGITANPWDGMKGPQTEILTPGFHWVWMLNVMYEIDRAEDTDAPDGIYTPYVVEANQFAYVSTKDGVPMKQGEILAPKWDNVEDFLDATKFLAANGESGTNIGYKGDQLTLVVSAGSYYVNRKFYTFQQHKVDLVEKGEVGIVRSTIQTASDEVCAKQTIFTTPDGVKAALVPKDCRGVWEEPLLPNAYRLHPKAYKITPMSSMRDDVEFLGDYKKETIKFTTDDEGNIKAKVSPETYKTPQNAESSAIVLRIGGWKIPNDFRLFFQVPPEQAPKAYVTLGDMAKIKKFLVGSSRSIFRTQAQGKDILSCDVHQQDVIEGEGKKAKVIARKGEYKDLNCVADARKVSDLINGRDVIEQDTLKAIHDFAEGYGVNVISTLMGEPAIPSEYLIPRMRADFAKSLEVTYDQEKKAQDKRKQVEEARATANQQSTLVTARMKNEAADQVTEQMRKMADAKAYEIKMQGIGERDADIERAKGQRELVGVMGKELIQEQVIYKMAIEAAERNPNMVKTADIVVSGDGTSGANLLGTSNMAMFLENLKKQRDAEKAKSN